MTPTPQILIDAQHVPDLARHDERITALEGGQKKTDDKLDKLQYWIMGTLGMAVVQLFVLLFKR